jgi:glutathione S-transferase
MKIYGDVISPFVRMTLVTAHEVGLAHRVEHIAERVSATEANPRLTALSPIGKVPVLETDHHHPLYDSRVIVEYLCHVAGNSTLIPDDGVKRFRILTLLALAQGLGDAAVALRQETAFRPQGLQWQDWIDRTLIRIAAALDDLEETWQACLAEVNAGSIAAAVVLSYIDYRHGDLGWRGDRPKLAAFHARFADRDSMIRTALPTQ